MFVESQLVLQAPNLHVQPQMQRAKRRRRRPALTCNQADVSQTTKVHIALDRCLALICVPYPKHDGQAKECSPSVCHRPQPRFLVEWPPSRESFLLCARALQHQDAALSEADVLMRMDSDKSQQQHVPGQEQRGGRWYSQAC